MKILCRISELVNSEELKSGDYVSYKFDSGVYIADTDITGHNAEQRLESAQDISWRVLNASNNAITIIPDRVPNELVLRGVAGAIKGADVLNSAMNELYSCPKAGLFARCIAIEDINEFEKCTEISKRHRAFILDADSATTPLTLNYRGNMYEVFETNPNSKFYRTDGGGIIFQDKVDGIEARKLAVGKPVYITYVYYKNESAKGIWLKDNAYWLATSLNRFDIPDTYYKLPYVNCSIISEATLFISCGINNSMCLGVCPIVTIPGNMMIDCTKRINHGQSPENAWRLIEKMA